MPASLKLARLNAAAAALARDKHLAGIVDTVDADMLTAAKQVPHRVIVDRAECGETGGLQIFGRHRQRTPIAVGNLTRTATDFSSA